MVLGSFRKVWQMVRKNRETNPADPHGSYSCSQNCRYFSYLVLNDDCHDLYNLVLNDNPNNYSSLIHSLICGLDKQDHDNIQKLTCT